jgi:hypothetical protein
MTKLFVSGTEGRAYQEFRGRDLKMSFFSRIGSFFKRAANKVNSAILKPIGNFITHTVPDTGGKILSGIKDVANSAVDKVPAIIDAGGKAIGTVIDKASSAVSSVNPLNSIGFYVMLGLGAFVVVEFLKSPASSALAQRVPLALP